MKIFGVGMNYIRHNKELDGTLYQPKEPVIFTKADSALLKDGKPFFVPDFMGRIDYEAELVVRICRLGKTIPVQFAHRYYDAVTVGIDFTAREWQEKLRAEGKPWELCKGFDGSASGFRQTVLLIFRPCVFISTLTKTRYKRAMQATCSSKSTS